VTAILFRVPSFIGFDVCLRDNLLSDGTNRVRFATPYLKHSQRML
jgi:hypothetical protein